MSKKCISEPTEFRKIDGTTIELPKTFELNDHHEDETLRLYLRKAGLSDDISQLTLKQRREYISDVVKSSKKLGYWTPTNLADNSSTPLVVRQRQGLKTSLSNKSLQSLSNLSVVSFDTENVIDTEMLRLYLSKAGLSADISNLTEEQQREYVLDIIQSNKMPGYWLPRSMKNNAPPAVRPPALTPLTKRRSLSKDMCAAPNGNFSKHYVTNTKPFISAPINFQHISGDMTRDRTRNAIDLANDNIFHDNVLKKYMIERGITGKDVRGLRKQELIQKIVHSNFEWMPSKSEPQAKIVTAATLEIKATETKFSNYATITSQIVDLTDLNADDIKPIHEGKILGERLLPVLPATKSINRPSTKPPQPPPPPPPLIPTIAPLKTGNTIIALPTNTKPSHNEIFQHEKNAQAFTVQSSNVDTAIAITAPLPLQTYLTQATNKITTSVAPIPIPPPIPQPLTTVTSPYMLKTKTGSDLSSHSDSGRADFLVSIYNGVTLKSQKNKLSLPSTSNPSHNASHINLLSELKFHNSLRNHKGMDMNSALDESFA